jgi:hypothetical protein
LFDPPIPRAATLTLKVDATTIGIAEPLSLSAQVANIRPLE